MKIQIPRDANYILEKLSLAGYEAYVVGGCVRDSLLGDSPHDWDITTNALPLQVKEIFGRTVDTGLKHGTVTVMRGNTGYEVTTYRTDGDYSDGRHPDNVTFVMNLEEDLKRRDFTINAMAYNETRGLVDLFGGCDDLKNGIIRCVGSAEERFSEDALRMLRAVRFAARFGYTLDPEVVEAIKKLAPTLSKVSAERITSEFVKLLTSDHPEMVRILYETGLTKVFFPEFDEAMNTPQNHPHHCYNVGEHLIESLKASCNDPVVRLAMMLHDIGKPRTLKVDDKGITHFYGHPKVSADMAKEILVRWKLDNDTIRRVCRLVQYHDYGIGREVTESLIRKAMSIFEDDFELLLEVNRADILAQSDFKKKEKLEANKKYGEISRKILKENQCFRLKDLAVSGKDLMEAGAKPGPGMGDILKKLFDAVLEDPSLNDREVLLKMAEEMINNE